MTKMVTSALAVAVAAGLVTSYAVGRNVSALPDADCEAAYVSLLVQSLDAAILARERLDLDDVASARVVIDSEISSNALTLRKLRSSGVQHADAELDELLKKASALTDEVE